MLSALEDNHPGYQSGQTNSACKHLMGILLPDNLITAIRGRILVDCIESSGNDFDLSEPSISGALEELKGRKKSVGELGVSRSDRFDPINEGITSDKVPIANPKKTSGEETADRKRAREANYDCPHCHVCWHHPSGFLSAETAPVAPMQTMLFEWSLWLECNSDNHKFSYRFKIGKYMKQLVLNSRLAAH